MATVSDMWERVRGFDPERMLGLRPSYPNVALELNRREAVLVRLRRRRGGRPALEAHGVRTVDETSVPSSIFQATGGSPVDLSSKLRELFERTGTRAGRVSLVLPDNLAKVSLLHLPERPPTRKQLDELVRFKMRRAVPFRLDEAVLSYHAEPDPVGRGLSILVAVVRRSLVEQYERVLESLGARIGLIDLCTTNLLNLCRPRIEAACAEGGDVALLNGTPNYFSLAIVRAGRLIFFRCKTFAVDDEQAVGGPEGLLVRELASSFSYYQEKLAGEVIRTVLLRDVARPLEEIAARLLAMGIERVEDVRFDERVEAANGALDPATAQRLAPAIGAAVAR